ncbi:MAG TPA: hypothetical protein VF392_08030 [Terracidiphilus sp.]
MHWLLESFELRTSEGEEELTRRLEAAVYQAPTFQFPMPGDFAQIAAKPLVGRVNGRRFKAVLRGDIGRRIATRRGQVIIAGTIEGSTVHVTLRPPLFSVIWVVLWTILAAAGLVLSFFGPARFAPVQLVILGMLVLPWAVILPFYRRETYLVRAQLRQIFPVIE